MPRKKSNTKKAREAVKKEAGNATSIEQKNDNVSPLPKNSDDITQEIANGESDFGTESSTSEEEDDYGELITEEVEDGINQVLTAIRNYDTDKLLNPDVRFFEDPEKAAAKISRTETHKPIYLKDYHRMNILSGNTFKDDEEEDEEQDNTVDGKQSYAAQQKEERSQLLQEIKSAFNEEAEEEEEDDENDGFLTKKAPSKRTASPKLTLPDPEKNEEKFLEEFVNNQAWIPKKGDKVISLDHDAAMEEDDEEFEDAVEKFENAYNFRYEDPNAADIVSYARTQATLRRSENSSRRRKREDGKQQKQQDKNEKEKSIQKKKKEKVHKLTDVLEQLKMEYGADIDKSMVKKITDTLLNSDYKNNEWDQVVSELFDEEFYKQKGKPTWDDDDEVMADFYKEQRQHENTEGTDEEPSMESSANKSRKEKLQEKRSKKKEKHDLQDLVENAVDQNKLAIIDEVEKETEERKSRALTKDEQELKFRYREVSPESYGLSTREIFAADDSQLNDFIGLKKFAPYRSKEQRMRDKRKVTKSRRLRDWRKEVFHNENGLTQDVELDGDEIALPVESNVQRKKVHKKRKHNSSS